MLLNSTMKLGYLEGAKDEPSITEARRFTLKLDEKGFEVLGARPRPPSRPGSNQSQVRRGSKNTSSKERPTSQGGRASLKGTREGLQRSTSRDLLKAGPAGPPGAVDTSPTEPTWQPLEWTQPPQRDVRREGAVLYSVSTPATQDREHKPHLVRTTRIEPAKGYAKRPPVPKKVEKITVTEKDLRRCGSDLQKLRECQVLAPAKAVEEEAPLTPSSEEAKRFELSFKSNFAKICREGADTRDPWKDLGHPDELRQLTVEDLTVNQVYIHALSPRKIEFDPSAAPQQEGRNHKLLRSSSASTRASSADVALRTWHGGDDRPRRTRLRPERAQVGQRALSLGPQDPADGSETRVESPIQPISMETPRITKDDETPEHKRAMRTFLKGAAGRGETRAVWMTINRATGDIQVYRKEAGERLEIAFRTGRSSVPLAGLEDSLEGCIVSLDKSSPQFATLRHMDGSEADVQRFSVTAYSMEMTVRVVGPPHGSDAWSFAPRGDAGEERLLQLGGDELVRPPSPKLPPVDRTRPSYFINAGADWAGSDSF